MVTSLQQRLALAVLIGVLVIPLVVANNGGLNHLLFCEATVAQSFAVSGSAAGSDEGSQLTSSTRLTADEPAVTFDGDEAVTQVCEGVTAEVSAEPIDEDEVTVSVTIHNRSELPWRGSVRLVASGNETDADLTAAIGNVRPGDSRSASVRVRIPEGQTDIAGTILLGP